MRGCIRLDFLDSSIRAAEASQSESFAHAIIGSLFLFDR